MESLYSVFLYLYPLSPGKEDARTYQNILLKDYKASETRVLDEFRTTMKTIADDFTERCRKFDEHPVFKHLVTILDCRKWPTNDSFSVFGDNEMRELSELFQGFIAGNSDQVRYTYFYRQFDF